MNAVLESQTQQLIDQYPLGPVTRCHANPYPLYGISETGKTMTHHLKDQDTLPDPAPQGFPARLAFPPRGRGSHLHTHPSRPRRVRDHLQRHPHHHPPRPLRVTTRNVEGAKATNPTPCTNSTWTQLPSALADPHLFGRHRPLPRAAPAALAHTTAAVRHLRHLQAFRPAHSHCVTSGLVVTTHLPLPFWLREAPQIDPANGFGCVFM